ncbi:TVG0934632 [Thermoplasma volcanium GSS1]|uniref:TVG0934632 protein n=1 Tax=Thermoplasma volcanium (strain ATCC 51530 / DSM 4299 / JCM 9571 / NBRC 15438 / GSS1) TaxID=273116 RepID=Q97AA0_THEVO|nr:TVG0934632 [Thermoplasma volcanium GSS1]
MRNVMKRIPKKKQHLIIQIIKRVLEDETCTNNSIYFLKKVLHYSYLPFIKSTKLLS